MRLLHVTADWKWTGPAEPMLHAAAGLRARGHDVDVAFPAPPPDHAGALEERALARGFPSVLSLRRKQGYVPFRDAPEVRELRACLQARSYDVVHAHHTRDQLLASRAVRGLNTRLVFSWHHGTPIPRTPWRRLALGPGRASGLVMLTEAVAQAARRDLGWPAERVAVVPGCVDTELFQPRPVAKALRHELGLDDGARVVGLVARLQPHRRVDLLLEALARARAKAPELRLLVVGRGTRAREVLEQPVAALGLTDAVVRAGYRRDDYRDVLSIMDALVFLVPGSDGSCRAALEAMAMGLPVIATGRGALPEIVRDRETGRVLPEHADAFAEALIDLVRDPVGWEARGVAARRHVLARHGIAQQAERLERLYTDLCGTEVGRR